MDQQPRADSTNQAPAYAALLKKVGVGGAVHYTDFDYKKACFDAYNLWIARFVVPFDLLREWLSR